MIFINKRVEAIKKRNEGLSTFNYNFDFGPKNNDDVEFLASARMDIEYLVNELQEAEKKVRGLEKTKLNNDILIEYYINGRKKLSTENKLLENENKYLRENLKAIQRVSEIDKENSNLNKINEITSEVMEEIK